MHFAGWKALDAFLTDQRLGLCLSVSWLWSTRSTLRADCVLRRFERTSDIFLEMEKTTRFLEAVEEQCCVVCVVLLSSPFCGLQDMYAKQGSVLYHNNVHAADVAQSEVRLFSKMSSLAKA